MKTLVAKNNGLDERRVYEYGKGSQWRSMPLRIALGFPSSYAAAMSNLGFLWVYHILNSGDGVRCDRFFYPEDGTSKTLSSRIAAVETGRPISSYDVVAFSLPYEADYPKMVWLLNAAGIEPVAEKRMGLPLVIAGGIAVGTNPEPVADFLDAIVIGEAEPVIGALVAALGEALNASQDRREMVERLARVKSVYVPALYSVDYAQDGTLAKVTPDKAIKAAKLDAVISPAHSSIVSDAAVFKGMFLVEMSRGCPNKCRFCLSRSIGRNFRPAEEKGLLDAVQRGLEVSKRIGLIGTAFAETAAIDAVCAEAAASGGRVSFSSVRLNNRVLLLLRKWGDTIDNETLAIAPEVATPRLRKVIDKDLGDSLGDFLAGDIPSGLRAMKLYYLLGVPGERDEDVLAIAEEARSIAGKAAGKGLKVSLSVNPLVPKAHTAFQWMKPDASVEIKRKIKLLKKELSGRGGVSVSGMGVREAEMQTTLSLGDRRLGRVIADVAEAGCGTSAFAAAMRRHDLDIAFYAGRERARDEILPWGIVDHGTSRDALWQQYSEAQCAAN